MGFLFGFSFFLSLLWWLYLFGVGALLGGCFLLSLWFFFFGVCFLWVKKKISSPFLSLFLFPLSLWLFLEWTRASGPLGVEWGILGYTQYKNLPIVQFAEYTGVWGVSSLVLLVNFSLFYLLLTSRERKIKSFLPLLLTLLFLLGIGKWGNYKLKEKLPEGDFKVVLVQPSILQKIKWEEKYLPFIFSRYESILDKIKEQKIDLIVFPEASLPGYLTQPYFREKAKNLALRKKTFLLLGGLWEEKEKYYNSAWLLSPQGEILERYDKIKLVPFGEKIPFSEIFPWLRGLGTLVGSGNFSPGKKFKVFRVKDKKFSVLICYEGTFGNLTRKFVKEGAQFLVNITNDAWFKNTHAPYQHFGMLNFRAVENRVWVLRSANTGISAIIDPWGRVLKTRGLFEVGALEGKISPPLKKTFYTRWGDLLPLFSLFLTLIIFSWGLSKSKRKP